jgi:type VI secretion system FHA domain protein
VILTLEATGPHASTLGTATRHTFDRAGGTIGRAPGNDWVLAHPYVSGCHARILWLGERFTIEDTRSSNGIFINSLERRLPPGQQHVLAHGDTIYIDPFEISVSIGAGADVHQTQVSPHPAPIPEDPFAAPPSPSPPAPRDAPLAAMADPRAGDAVDPLDLLGFSERAHPSPQVPRASDLLGGSPLHDQYRPPAPPAAPPAAPAKSPPAGPIPDDYNPLLGDDLFEPSPAPPAAPAARPERPSPRRTDPPAPARAAGAEQIDAGVAAPLRREPERPGARVERRRPSGPAHRQPPPEGRRAPAEPRGLELDRLLAGAGLDPAAITPELAESFGRILRVVVAGVMEVLHARQQIKDEFGMRLTTFRPADNNPLKFSANLEDALHNLLVKRNAAYLGPVDAFEDAFTDMRNHQVAMLAGMRQAFETMFAAFNPERLEAEFDRQLKKGSLLSVPAKLRYWDLYRERFDDMVRDPEATFSELFGDEFARAYEEQLERLKTRPRGGAR